MNMHSAVLHSSVPHSLSTRVQAHSSEQINSRHPCMIAGSRRWLQALHDGFNCALTCVRLSHCAHLSISRICSSFLSTAASVLRRVVTSAVQPSTSSCRRNSSCLGGTVRSKHNKHVGCPVRGCHLTRLGVDLGFETPKIMHLPNPVGQGRGVAHPGVLRKSHNSDASLPS
jgi:hypothetical protein